MNAKPGMFPDWYTAGLAVMIGLLCEAALVGIVYGVWLLFK